MIGIELISLKKGGGDKSPLSSYVSPGLSSGWCDDPNQKKYAFQITSI